MPIREPYDAFPGDSRKASGPGALVYRALAGALAAAALLAVSSRAESAAAGFRYWDPADTSAVPKTLSAMGLYAETPGRNARLVPQARHYEVNSPLWSDDAKKKRWVILKPGRSIGFRELDDYWDYPDSAVFVKEFAIDTVPGDTSTRVLWETRVLINRKEWYDEEAGIRTDHWYGYSYKWDADQRDARLIPPQGREDAIRVWPEGRGGPSRMKKWVFPKRYECDRCHWGQQYDGARGRTILGFFTAQLNRPAPDTAGINQLEWFFRKGVLAGARPASWEASPRWRGIEDASAGVDVRARSYIAANCSGCHGYRGGKTGAYNSAELNYDFHEMKPAMEFRGAYTSSFGRDTVPPFFYPKDDPDNPGRRDSLPIKPALVVAGYPEKSVILYRQIRRNTEPGNFDRLYEQMPILGTFEADGPAVALLERWIREMPRLPISNIGIAVTARPGAPRIRFQGDRLFIEADALAEGAGASMTSLDGRRIPLRRLGPGLYQAPAGLPRGIYFVRVGAMPPVSRFLP